MIEIWRRDAVYRFEFWPGAQVEPPREMSFRAGASEVDVRYTRPTDSGHLSARQAVLEIEQRCRDQEDEDTRVVSSGVRPFVPRGDEAWRCEVDMMDGTLVVEAIAWEYDDGLVVTFERGSPAEEVLLSSEGKFGALACRAERVQKKSLLETPSELSYALGPIRILVPESWLLRPHVVATVLGDPRFKSLKHTFEFAVGPPPPDWYDMPHYVESHIVDEDFVLVQTDAAEEAFAEGIATSRCWAVVPPPPNPHDNYHFPVEVVVSTVIHWSSGAACRIWVDHTASSHEFERDSDLALLRDLVLRVGASGLRFPRTKE